jgi:hypothetical protein
MFIIHLVISLYFMQKQTQWRTTQLKIYTNHINMCQTSGLHIKEYPDNCFLHGFVGGQCFETACYLHLQGRISWLVVYVV